MREKHKTSLRRVGCVFAAHVYNSFGACARKALAVTKGPV